MSWAIGFDANWKRDIGYGVPAKCDHPGCDADIDRGLSYVCGSDPQGGDHGCGLFFCEDHRHMAGERRDNVHLCSRCYFGRGQPYTPKQDTAEWITWKLTDESWAEWRQVNPEEVSRLKAAVEEGA